VSNAIFRPDEDQFARTAVMLGPERLIENPTPILFDEWQVEPAIWNRVRRTLIAPGRVTDGSMAASR
jgi:hypothetical protein